MSLLPNSTCLYCQKLFYRRPSYVKRKKRPEVFCQLSCAKAWRRENPPKNAECSVCKKPFWRTPAHQARNSMGLFCSQACFWVAEKGENNPAYIQGSACVECLVCQKSFSVDRSRTDGRKMLAKYCSVTCRKWARRNWKMFADATCTRCGKPCDPKDHYHSRRRCRDCADSPLDYSCGFTETVKESIMLRDNYSCVRCTAIGVRPAKPICVHHIDGKKDCHHPTNLVTLCYRCHRTVHADPNFLLSPEWMRKYGSYLYAAACRPVAPVDARPTLESSFRLVVPSAEKMAELGIEEKPRETIRASVYLESDAEPGDLSPKHPAIMAALQYRL